MVFFFTILYYGVVVVGGGGLLLLLLLPALLVGSSLHSPLNYFPYFPYFPSQLLPLGCGVVVAALWVNNMKVSHRLLVAVKFAVDLVDGAVDFFWRTRSSWGFRLILR